VEAQREETKRTFKETINRWNEAGLRETRDIKLWKESRKSKRVEGGVGGGKNS
jgi:hypothetical protein